MRAFGTAQAPCQPPVWWSHQARTNGFRAKEGRPHFSLMASIAPRTTFLKKSPKKVTMTTTTTMVFYHWVEDTLEGLWHDVYHSIVFWRYGLMAPVFKLLESGRLKLFSERKKKKDEHIGAQACLKYLGVDTKAAWYIKMALKDTI